MPTVKMTHCPTLPAGLAAQVAQIEAGEHSGVATLYDVESAMLLQAGFKDGHMIAWTVIHPLARDEAQHIIDRTPGETLATGRLQ